MSTFSLMGSKPKPMARSAATRKSPAMAGVRCSAFYGDNNYKALKLTPGATEKEVKSAFRKLALKYHPDVCKGTHCSIRFNQIHQAYENLLDGLKREEERIVEEENYDNCDDYSEDEEWMGYEAAFVFSGGQSQSIYI